MTFHPPAPSTLGLSLDVADPETESTHSHGDQGYAVLEVYSISQVAELFGRTERTIRNWVRNGRLKRGGFARAGFFSADAIRDFLDGKSSSSENEG